MKRKNKAFSLIELMVVTGIIILLAGGALVAYTNFQQRRESLAQVRRVADQLRTVRVKVAAVEGPSGSAIGVKDYKVEFGTNTVDIKVDLNDGSVWGSSQVSLSETRILNSPAPLVYTAGSGELQIGGAGPVTLDFCGGGKYWYQIRVNKNGTLSGPVYKGSCP